MRESSMANYRMKKIGVYGGTFDPIHFGHLNLAIDILEARELDEIWFCPARLNPHKQAAQPVADITHRVEMLRLAISDIPQFKIIEIEAKKEGPSYSIDTLRALLASEKNNNFSLILSDDVIPGFFNWHQPEEIVKLVPLLIGRRSTTRVSPLIGNPVIVKAFEDGMTPTHFMDISSTEIRRRLAKGLYCGHLVPEKVMDYIYRNQLYSIHK